MERAPEKWEEYSMPQPRPGLQRSREDRMVGGVCAGIGDWLGWSPTAVRILYVILSLASAAFPGILVYVLLWILMPEREDPRPA